MRLSLGLVLAVGLAGAASADTAMECRELGALVEALTGYSLTVPPAPNVAAWCVADGAVLRAEGWPRITVERLHLAGTKVDGKAESLSLVIGGLRVVPDLDDRSMDPRLRAALRLQTVDMMLTVRRSKVFDGLELRAGVIALSGGTELLVEADLLGAGFDTRTLLSSALSKLELEWKNDGQTLRPVMEALGERLVDGVAGSTAVDAARLFLRQTAENMPETLFMGSSRDELAQLVAALPLGRGRLVMAFQAEAGIGATKLAIAALSGDPLSAEVLTRLFAGASLSLDWQPGLQP
jgi:hypothetical protein